MDKKGPSESDQTGNKKNVNAKQEKNTYWWSNPIRFPSTTLIRSFLSNLIRSFSSNLIRSSLSNLIRSSANNNLFKPSRIY